MKEQNRLIFGGRSQESFFSYNMLFLLYFVSGLYFGYTHRYTHFSKCMVQSDG